MDSRVENDGPKVPKQAEAKRDGVINTQNYNFQQFLMLSKHYELTEVDRRTWLQIPAGTHCSTSSDTHQVVNIKRDFYQDVCIDNFKSDLINNVDHMRIWGNKPSSVSLAKQSGFAS